VKLSSQHFGWVLVSFDLDGGWRQSTSHDEILKFIRFAPIFAVELDILPPSQEHWKGRL